MSCISSYTSFSQVGQLTLPLMTKLFQHRVVVIRRQFTAFKAIMQLDQALVAHHIVFGSAAAGHGGIQVELCISRGCSGQRHLDYVFISGAGAGGHQQTIASEISGGRRLEASHPQLQVHSGIVFVALDRYRHFRSIFHQVIERRAGASRR